MRSIAALTVLVLMMVAPLENARADDHVEDACEALTETISTTLVAYAMIEPTPIGELVVVMASAATFNVYGPEACADMVAAIEEAYIDGVGTLLDANFFQRSTFPNANGPFCARTAPECRQPMWMTFPEQDPHLALYMQLSWQGLVDMVQNVSVETSTGFRAELSGIELANQLDTSFNQLGVMPGAAIPIPSDIGGAWEER